MEYKHCDNENFEDLSCGRVIYGCAGMPNFPVRLGNEIFRRCLNYSKKKVRLTVYDPCCGSAYLLTVLGFCNASVIEKMVGSDIDEKMISVAKKNMSLLTQSGLQIRKRELLELYCKYHKVSHVVAIKSLMKLEKLRVEIFSEIFMADCTKKIEKIIYPDIILTDVPYGDLVNWQGGEEKIDGMMEQLSHIAQEGAILAVISDKKTKYDPASWKRVEKQSIGKRRFEIYCI